MRAQPEHWDAYYAGGAAERAFARKYSLSDRSRYYWTDPQVEASVQTLFDNLARHPAPLVLDPELHAPGEAPAVAVVDLDHEAAEVVRLTERPLHLVRDRVGVARAPGREVRLDVLVVRERDEEVDVAGRRAPDAQAHRPGSAAVARGTGRTSPEPTATPARISASPPASAAVTGSPRKSAP